MGKGPLYLISHADRYSGVDPIHTQIGKKQIEDLEAFLPTSIPRFVVGTGRRFQEILGFLISRRDHLLDVPVFHTPFCGNADGLDPPDTIVMTNGETCKLGGNYIGLASPDFFDAWKFVASQPVGSVFCAGGELLGALGLKPIAKRGFLYELDSELETGRIIAPTSA